MLAAAAQDPIQPSDLLVRLDTPLDLLVDRLEDREQRQSRLEAVDRFGRRAELESGLDLLNALWTQRVVATRSQRPVGIRVDGLDPEAVDVVIEAIRRCGLGEM